METKSRTDSTSGAERQVVSDLALTTTGERVKALAARYLSIEQVAAHEACDPELIRSHFAHEHSAGKLLSTARCKQALFLRAIKHNDVMAQIALAKTYVGMSSDGPKNKTEGVDDHNGRHGQTWGQRKRLLQQFIEKYPHLLNQATESASSSRRNA